MNKKKEFNQKLAEVNLKYKDIVQEYIDLFCKKQDIYLEFQSGNLLCFGDSYFNLDDIIYDLNNNCKKGLIFKWQNKGLDAHWKYPDLPHMNYNSYVMGMTYEYLIKQYLNDKQTKRSV